MATIMRGIFPVIPTPFHEDMEVDYAGIRRLIDFGIECGATGFLTTAMSSEFYTLTDEEHNRIVEVILEHNNDRVPIVVGIASRSKTHGIEFAKHAQYHGAHAICSTPPVVESVLGKVSWEKAREYFSAIDSCVNIPIFIQNAPELGGTLTAEQMMQLAKENEHVHYTKEEGLNSQQVTKQMIDIWRDLPEGSFSGVFAGGGGFTMLGDLDHGACGVMPQIAFTDLYVEIWDRYFADDRNGARELHNLVVVGQLYEKYYWSSYAKYLMIKRGLIKSDAIRETTPLFDAQCYKEVDRIYEVVSPRFTV